MIFSDFKDKKLSSLGFGVMRLPLTSSKTSDIDYEKAEELIDLSMKLGINYYDTAFYYHGGESETFIGKVMKKYPRESYYLASKFPGYDLLTFPKFDEIFETQLKRCQTDYFDFYLLHQICELNYDSYLSPKYGIYDKFVKLKAEGKIKHIGLSSHALPETLDSFLDIYGDIIEFAQIQLNPMDWEFQRAKEAVEILNKRNIPIWVMEPLRGGSILDRMTVSEAFDFLKEINGVTVTLSGMSTIEQLKENAEIFSRESNLSAERKEEILINEKERCSSLGIPCTSCSYCTGYCPMKLDIPTLLYHANEFHLTDNDFIAPMAVAALPDDKQPKACISCGACKNVCPQKIDIPHELNRFSEELEKLDEIED